ncbi:TPA: kinase, partial [Escherichia coli]|nr:kinase [Escherichia coli]HBA8925443.1 kinase [Escherichia coli]
KLTRNYTRGAKGSISGAIYCVLSSLNIPENMIDYDTIDALESSVWTPGGYTFNSTITGADSAWNMLTTILQAAGSYPLLKNGMFSAGYTGIKAPVCAFTPQDYAGDGLTVTYQAPSRDDYNAVDVTWTDDNLTAGVVECRGSHSYNADEQKTESWTLTGVTDRNIAWQLGMRRLLSYQYQRMIFSFSTEMLALNCSYGDVV